MESNRSYLWSNDLLHKEDSDPKLVAMVPRDALLYPSGHDARPLPALQCPTYSKQHFQWSGPTPQQSLLYLHPTPATPTSRCRSLRETD